MSTLTNSRKHRPGGACVSPSVIAFGPTEAGLVAHRHRQADERPLRQVGAELEHDAASAQPRPGLALRDAEGPAELAVGPLRDDPLRERRQRQRSDQRAVWAVAELDLGDMRLEDRTVHL